VAEGQKPAMPSSDFITRNEGKRQIRPKKFDNCISTNISVGNHFFQTLAKMAHFLSVNRKIKYTIPTPHNFAKFDFTIK
jgi:hypothetical protein